MSKSYGGKRFPMSVTEEGDGSFTIEWDSGHSVTSVFNDWTEKDFAIMIKEQAELVIAELSSKNNDQ